MMKNMVIVVLLLGIIGQFIFYNIQKNKKRKEIETLIQYLMKVQDQLELPQMQQIQEGNLGILQSEIYKVVVMLREAYSNEARQKQYMVDMLSDISHQIKTPVAAIAIMVDLLESSDLTDAQRLEYADKIDKQTNRITWLIRNLLTLAQLEADVLPLKKELVDVNEMMKDIQDSLEIMAEVKGVSLQIEKLSMEKIYCDRHWMTEALLNITKNCVEHTGEGGYVKISLLQDNISTHIDIEDNGEGISEEHLPHIFERFYKADSKSTSSVGIGLAMAKQIIMKQNGTIDVKSEKNVGTHFAVKLFRVDTI